MKNMDIFVFGVMIRHTFYELYEKLHISIILGSKVQLSPLLNWISELKKVYCYKQNCINMFFKFLYRCGEVARKV